MVTIWALPAAAQERTWLQVEAQPTLREAEARARAYANAFSDVNGFRLGSGWYVIAFGPYTQADAAARLAELKRDQLVPGDAYVSDGSGYRQQFWPVGANTLNAPPQPPVTAAGTASAESAVLVPIPDETPAEARRSERNLTRAERILLQEALQWGGYYTAAIDGAIGPGTRRAMGAWQGAKGYEATGILTTRQREELIAGYRAEFAALGLAQVEDAEAGIRITLPTNMVEFDRYEPPFAHYEATTNDDVKVLLISQEGDQTTLFGLYDVMQTLEIVPLEGARERKNDSFMLTGQNAMLHSHTYAALQDGMVKGFTLIWRPEDEKLMTRVVQIMRDSFEPFGERALDAALADPEAEQSIDLLSGLDIRRPELSRTGFFVDAGGTVLTTVELLGQCNRITIGDDQEARVAARDDALGLAVLRPADGLSPIAYAAFQTGVPRLQSDVAVAGFSYGEVLDLPVLTYGTLSDLKGLAGEDSLRRLAMEVLPGDAGGPVFDATGAVLGALLPRAGGNRQLPEDVNFAAAGPAIAAFLAENGIETAAANGGGPIAPEDLTALASDMTVRVSCWN